MSEALLNDYAEEAHEKGSLSAGKVANLLAETWRARREADEQREYATKARQDAAETRKVLQRLFDAFHSALAPEEEAAAVETARANLRKSGRIP